LPASAVTVWQASPLRNSFAPRLSLAAAAAAIRAASLSAPDLPI